MPKATWSSLSTQDIDEAETREGSYAGALPPRGVYRFKVRYMKQGQSNAGNDKLVVFSTIDGTWKPDHKKYDGCPLWDHMPMTKESAFRAKALCAALGVSASDLMTKTVVDEDGNVTKIGSKVFKDKDVFLYVSVRVEKSDEYDDKLALAGPGYMAAPDEDEAEADETPATKPGKGKKKGKKGSNATEEDPF
jgi:hypothetical protein